MWQGVLKQPAKALRPLWWQALPWSVSSHAAAFQSWATRHLRAMGQLTNLSTELEGNDQDRMPSHNKEMIWAVSTMCARA